MIRTFLAALYGVIIGLRLAGVIDWSWALILLPLWVVPALAITGLCLVVLWLFVSDLRGRI